MKSGFHLTCIVFLTLTFCAGAASADCTDNGHTYGENTLQKQNDGSYLICRDGKWSPDFDKLIIGNAIYWCPSKDDPIQIAVLDKIKELCEGKPACRVDVNPTAIAPPDWAGNHCGPHFLTIDWHCSNVPIGPGPGPRSATPDGNTATLDCSLVEQLQRAP